MDSQYVEGLRRAEIELALDEIRSRKPFGASIIEIGGGAGWQARILAEAGFSVRSFDVPGSEFKNNLVFPVEEYDGKHIPAPGASFDVAFSSNTLEHIAELEAFQDELRRVMKPDGIAIHIVPSATWRIYTLLAHYPWLAKAAAKLIGTRFGWNESPDSQIVTRASSRRSTSQLLSRILLSPRHGERGNAVSELWLFSRFGWMRLFRRTGWRILAHYPNRLWYTGYELLNNRLRVETRQRLSRLLGSSCHVYVLRPHSLS